MGIFSILTNSLAACVPVGTLRKENWIFWWKFMAAY
jgi:hypothetical protein